MNPINDLTLDLAHARQRELLAAAERTRAGLDPSAPVAGTGDGRSERGGRALALVSRRMRTIVLALNRSLRSSPR
jgi:hypothetical protein